MNMYVNYSCIELCLSLFVDVTYHILFDGGTINSNNQKVYHVSVPYDAPLQSSVVKLTAKAVDAVGRPAEQPVKYSIIKQRSASNEAINFFQIEEETGVILTKKVSTKHAFSILVLTR